MNLSKRLKLELNRAVQKQKAAEHELRQLFWECTLRCNLNCRHCGSDCRMLSEQNDMPLADFLKVLDEIKTHQDPSRVMVITTGGEPTMRRDLARCGLEISKRGYVWGMVSNGMLLTPERLNEYVGNGLQSIGMSFDGFEDDHNWMRGNTSSYKNALVAIEAMKQHPDLTWDVITCVNKKNIKYLPEFGDFLISLGITRWRLFTVFPSGRAVNEPDLQISVFNKNTKQTYDYVFSRGDSNYNLNIGMLPEGIYSYSAKASLGGIDYKADGLFTVESVGVEALDLTANVDRMRSLASQTGGKHYYITDIQNLIQDLKNNPGITSVSRQETRYDDLINLKWLFFGILGLITVEWLLRKVFGIY